MRIQSNVQQSIMEQRANFRQGATKATDQLNSGSGTGIQLADANRVSDESRARFMQRNGIQRTENTGMSTVGLAAQSQTKAFLNAQNQGATTDTIDLAGDIRQLEENFNRIAANVARDTIKEYSAVATVNSGASPGTGGVFFTQGESSQLNEAGSTQLQNAVAGNTVNQAATYDIARSKIQDLHKRLQSTLQALAADAYAGVDKATQNNANAPANSNSTVTDVSVQEETKKLTQVTAATSEQTQTRPTLRQMGTAALSQANQAAPQTIGLMRG